MDQLPDEERSPKEGANFNDKKDLRKLFAYYHRNGAIAPEDFKIEEVKAILLTKKKKVMSPHPGQGQARHKKEMSQLPQERPRGRRLSNESRALFQLRRSRTHCTLCSEPTRLKCRYYKNEGH